MRKRILKKYFQQIQSKSWRNSEKIGKTCEELSEKIMASYESSEYWGKFYVNLEKNEWGKHIW